MPASATLVPYRSRRALRGALPHPARTMGALAGSSKKRNGDAFQSAFPGVNWVNDSQIILPAKFGGITVNRDGFDELAGTWYGATYHPDGDQAGWQQKFDAALKKYGAFNAYYGMTNTTIPPTPSPTPVVLTNPIQPTPVPIVQASGALPSSVSLVTALGYAPDGSLVYRGSDGVQYIRTANGYFPYTGAISATNPQGSTTPVTLPATNTTPAITVNVPPTTSTDQTSALIQQLMQQGASQQQAFQAALQSLAASGVQVTPAVQQQVASDVNAASATGGLFGMDTNTLFTLGATAVGVIVFILAQRKSRGSRRR